MSRCTNLVLILSLAACERADLATTPPSQFEAPRTVEAPPVEPATPQLEAEPSEPTRPIEPTRPAMAVEAPKQPLKVPEDDARCRSRAGCKWKGERETPRVAKKPAVPEPRR